MDLTLAFQLARYSRAAYGDLRDLYAAYPGQDPALIDRGDTQVAVFTRADAMIIAFRGTESGGDWQTNLRTRLEPVATGRVHGGFLDALNAVLPSLRSYERQWGGDVYLTGHSLGGALAALASTTIQAEATYTFGAPRAGDRAFAASLAHVERFVHAEDVVPKLPAAWHGYRHGGRCWRLHRNGRMTQGWGWWDGVVIPGTGKGFAAGAADHGIDDYIDALERVSAA